MLKQETRDIIERAAHENRISFYDLHDDERRIIVAHLLFTSDQGLIDADNRQHIQHAVANLIFYKANASSMAKLVHAIETAFISGDQEYEPHYADDVQTLLSDEWDDQNRRPNEHFEHDAMQRARDIKYEQNQRAFKEFFKC